MPWRVGVDEAGYGPNLGPLVVASTACHVPDAAPECLWTILERAVRRTDQPDDGRLIVDDSKKVNEGPMGLARLEAGVLAAHHLCRRPAGTDSNGEAKQRCTVLDYLFAVALGDSITDLHSEPWFVPDDYLPVVNEEDALDSVRRTLGEACASADVIWGSIQTVVVPAPRFNRLLDEWRVKSGVNASAVIALLNSTLQLPGDDPIQITVDKLGGRHFYAPLVNEAFPGGWVRVIREGPELCEYAVDGLGREIGLQFRPRADGADMNVALASMAAKYLREVCMRQFNRYWLAKIPGLKPTAGYPTDATRFFKEIRGLLKKDGVEKRMVWRER
jgi:hypothetical protein